MAVHARGEQAPVLQILYHLHGTRVDNQGVELVIESCRHLLRVGLSQIGLSLSRSRYQCFLGGGSR